MKRFLRIHDPVLFGLALIATIIGLVFIFDAGYARSLARGDGAIPADFRNQAIYSIPAMIGFFAANRLSPDWVRKLSKPFWLLILGLVIATAYVGVTKNGATRWIGPEKFAFQPAEFAKVAVILYLAVTFADRPTWPKKIPKRDFWWWLDRVASAKVMRLLPALWVFVMFYYIEDEPDLGTASVVAAAAFAMCLVGGASRKTVLVSTVIAALGLGVMVTKEPYRMERINNHVHRWEAKNADDVGFQTVQSEAAMADGGLLGVGFGNGRAKHVMPASTTDFVMATVAEETGLLGSLLVLAVLAGMVGRLVWQASRATSHFAALVLYGVAAWIGIQASVNVMMANGTLPAIGIPLPFISYGGSSLIALWLVMGLSQAVLAPPKEPATDEEVVKGGTPRAAHRNWWGNWRPRLSRA